MCMANSTFVLDNHRCRVFGCGMMIGLEDHHIVPRSHGDFYFNGELIKVNDVRNRISLCNHHHTMVTNNQLTDFDLLTKLQGTIPDFRWEPPLEWHKNREELRRLKRN